MRLEARWKLAKNGFGRPKRGGCQGGMEVFFLEFFEGFFDPL
jgi:hypothetical protein